MIRTFVFLLLFLLPFLSRAQEDTLWIRQQDGYPYLLHKVRSGENLFLLSRRYSVPPAVLADVNKVNYQEGLPAGSKFRIPVAAYNFIKAEGVSKSRPIYYKAQEEDNLHSISRMFNITQSTVQRWNQLDVPGLEPGQVLQVGWIAYDATQVPFADTAKAAFSPSAKATSPAVSIPVAKDAVKKIVPTGVQDTTDTVEETALQQLYEQQIRGMSLSEESGAAVFFPLKMKTAPGVYYAFHNTAAKGTVLRIANPASGKVIYAKVIGSIPALKEYYNTVVGISNNALSVLGATDRRMFCKIKYR